MKLEVHPSLIEKLSKMPCAQARRFLKPWFTRGEQNQLMRQANCKKNSPVSTMQQIYK